MTFFFILIYIFFFFIRLQDWWRPLLGFPVDDVIFTIILLGILPSTSRIIKIIKLPQSKFFALFILAVFLSDLVNNDIAAAYEYGIKYIKFFVVYVIIVLSIDSFKKLNVLATFLCLLVLFIAYQGIIQAQTGTNWAGQSLYWGDRIRWVGLFDGANTTALAFVFVMPFLLEYFFGPWGIRYKVFSVIAALFIMSAFYFANSRGGFLSLMIVVFFFLYMRMKSKKGVIIAVVITFTLLLIAPSRMSEIDDKDKSSRGRIHAWDESLQMVRYHNPLFGVGKGHFRDYTSLPAHNAFLQHLGETGLIGAFFWLGFIYASIKGNILVMRKEGIDPGSYSLYRGHYLGLVGLLAGTMFISADHELLYICVALMTAIMLIEKIDLRFSLRDLKILGIVNVSVIFIIYIVVNLYKIIYF